MSPIYLTLMRRRALLFVLRRHAHRCKNTLTQIRARRYKYKYKYTTSARPTCVSICVLSSPTQMLNCSNGSAAFVYGCVLPPEWRLVATATATASAPPPSAHPAIHPLVRPRPPPPAQAHWQPFFLSAQSLASFYFRGQRGANIKNIDFEFNERPRQKRSANHSLLLFLLVTGCSTIS